jgi:hypothetical protein
VNRLKGPLGLAVLIVLCLAAGGAVAKGLITGRQIKDHSITGRDVKRHSIPLSALKTVPSSKAGRQGERGSPGLRGDPGAPGSPGVCALCGGHAVSHGIQDEITPSSNLEFVGEPTGFPLSTGEGGVIETSFAVGTTSPTISADEISFGICFANEAGGAEELEEVEEGGKEVFGFSPTVPSGQRIPVTVSSSFFLEPGEGEAEGEGPFLVELGPCVLNESTSPLDDNSRVQGYVLTSSG